MGNPIVSDIGTSKKILETIKEVQEQEADALQAALEFYESEIPKRLLFVDQAFLSYPRRNVYIDPDVLHNLKMRIQVRYGYSFSMFALTTMHGKYGIALEINH